MRLFVAVPVPEHIADDLADLCSGIPGARWVPPENFHITLRFLGEIDGAQADDVHESLSRIAAPGFELSLASMGAFGDQKKTRALWAGVDPSQSLSHLRDKVESAAVRAGLPPEPRRFKPHVTLARFRNGNGLAPEIHQFITRNALYRSEPFVVDHFTLFQSFLGGEGAIYRPEVEYELARRAA
ncbi:RNA 2',3'-cyclic phosphodiesterase [Limibacillus halophilus]|jgi:2'-5' RNA ligase